MFRILLVIRIVAWVILPMIQCGLPICCRKRAVFEEYGLERGRVQQDVARSMEGMRPLGPGRSTSSPTKALSLRV